MSRIYHHLALLLFLLPSSIYTQQLALSTYQIVQSDPMNPAQVRQGNANGLFFAIQQRTRQGTGWRSSSQYLNFHGRPQGSKGTFRMGLNFYNDWEHTERRLSVTPTISARVFENAQTEVHIGILAGLISWGSNYLQRAIYDLGDPIALDRTNLIEVNAGVGASFRHVSSSSIIEAGISGSQLSGNLIASPLEGFRLYPSIRAEGTYLLPASQGIWVGPRVFFQSIFHPEVDQGPGNIDLGLSGRIPEKNLWAGASYRTGSGTISVGAGFPVLQANPKASSHEPQQSLNAMFGFQYPVALRDGFGPSVDLGLVWNFGRERFGSLDTLPLAHPFWLDETAMVEHKQTFLDPLGPLGLKAQTELYPQSLYLTYTWPDQSYAYCGAEPLVTSDGLVKRIGYEWIGTDGLVRGIVGKVVPDALYPDSTLVRDPENLEVMEHLAWIEVNCQLRVDEEGAKFTSEITYEGEFSRKDLGGDTLEIPVVFDGKDTLLYLHPGKIMSNLELAALKLYSLRSKAEFELGRFLGDRFRIIREENAKVFDLEVEMEAWKRPIILLSPRITSDNSNLQAFQQNSILLKFARKEGHELKDDPKWIPRKETDDYQGAWELPTTEYDSDDTED